MYNKLLKEEDYTANMGFAKAVLKQDYTIMSADEILFQFLGRSSNLFFNQMLHPDYEKEFFEMCGQMPHGETYRLITLLRDCDGTYHPVDIHIRSTPPEADKTFTYLLDIYSLDSIEFSHLAFQQRLDKYRTFMGIAGLVYMEYWPETGRMVFYNYAAQKSHILYEAHIDKWFEQAREYAEDGKGNIAELNQMHEKLKGLANQFNAVIKTGFLNASHIKETLEIDARYISRHNMELIEGVVYRKDITEDDIPYYLTKAGKDPATGLLNKRALIDYTNDCLAVGEDGKFYMILIDIDDFKTINDTYGHLMGDKAIILLAETMVETLDGRGIAGRFGGDEFFMLTEEMADEEQLRRFLKAFVSKLRMAQAEKLGDLRFTLSMGISQYPEAGYTFNSMFAVADKAVYIAKEKGKNRYIIYRPEMHDKIDVTGVHGGSGISVERMNVMKKAVRVLTRCVGDIEEQTFRGILEDILEVFELDNITIYYGEGFKKNFAVGDCPKALLDISYIKIPEYASLIYDDNMVTVNRLLSVEKVDKELYEKLNSHNCGAFIQMAFPSFGGAECVIAFNMFGRNHKWSEAEINYLDILGNTIYAAFTMQQLKK